MWPRLLCLLALLAVDSTKASAIQVNGKTFSLTIDKANGVITSYCGR